MEKALPATIVDLGGVSGCGKKLFQLFMHGATLNAGFHRLNGHLLTAEAGLPHVTLGITRLTANNSSCEVAVVSAPGIAREDVEND